MGVPIRMRRVRTWPGYAAWCPALPGCRVFAQTRRAARRRLTAAVRGYLERLDVTLPAELARRSAADATWPAA